MVTTTDKQQHDLCQSSPLALCTEAMRKQAMCADDYTQNAVLGYSFIVEGLLFETHFALVLPIF